MVDIPLPPFRRAFDAARDPLTARNALGITTTGGGGSGFITAVTAPLQVTGTTLSIDLSAYLTSATAAATYQPLDGDLTAIAALSGTNTIYYRSAANTWSAVTVGTGLSFSGGTLTATGGGGGGNVSNSGTPTSGQYAKWVTATTIEGVAPATVLSDIGAQPLDGDLTAIAALTGTNTIYYRSASNTWSAVTIGTNLTFTGGTLAASGGGSSTVLPGPPQGRLTLQTATPVMTTTQSAKTTIFYTPYVGNQIPIYDGTNMVMTTFAELSNVTTASSTGSAGPAAVSASSVYDLFVWSNGGTVTLTRGPAWTSDTARSAGTALVMVNGILLNNAAITNGPAASRGTYVGTVRSNASSQLDWIYGAVSALGTAGFFGVWNAYNRVEVGTFVGDNTNSWTYAVTTIRAANASTTMRVSIVRGLDEDAIEASYQTQWSAGTNIYPQIGLDSTSSGVGVNASGGGTAGYSSARYSGVPGIGFHFVQACEACQTATSSTILGDNGLAMLQTGMIVQFKA